MQRLIILRGPPGIGKTKISEHLVHLLDESKTYYLSLDFEEGFEQNIQSALTYDQIIAEMFFGNSHTTRPEEWLNRFGKYCKVSFILYASFGTCYRRARTRLEYRDYDEERYKELYYGFRFLCLFNVFNLHAKIKELWINTEYSDPSTIAQGIWDMSTEICKH